MYLPCVSIIFPILNLLGLSTWMKMYVMVIISVRVIASGFRDHEVGLRASLHSVPIKSALKGTTLRVRVGVMSNY